MLKGILGAIIGLVTGVIVAMGVAMILADAAGQPTAAGAAMFGLLPTCALGGLVAGALLGSRGRLWMVALGAGAIVAAGYGVVRVIVVLDGARAARRIAATTEPDGCRNIPIRPTQGTRTYYTFERICGKASSSTMNVSLLPYVALSDTVPWPRGPGNVVVIEVPDMLLRSGIMSGGISIDEVRDGRQVIRYDGRVRVITRNTPVGGVNFAFVPDSSDRD
jgi:hypothetical protein